MNGNPLQQYFRRPGIYITLPYGAGNYEPGMIDANPSGEVPVYPMTSIDEITLRTPDALFNGQAIIDIVTSCIPAISDPWKIRTCDLDTILMAIKIVSKGEEMDIETQCPSCNEEAKYGVNLVGLMAKISKADYSKPLMFNDLEIKFQSPTYRESNINNLRQLELQKALITLNGMEDSPGKQTQLVNTIKEINLLMVEYMTTSIQWIKTPECVVTEKNFIREFLLNCENRISDAIKNYGVELKNATEVKPIKIKCIKCSHEYEQPFTLNLVDFFD